MKYGKHPCIDCGQPCVPKAKRCRRCFKLYWETHKKRKNCIDCCKPISVFNHAQRCNSCSGKRKKAIKGPEHYNWKGGKSKNGKGYIFIYQPGHPRAYQNRVLEHIIIWEQANGIPLPKGWVIHHLNGIKDDNRPANLMALPNKKHYLVLQAKAKRIQELEALLKNGQHQLL